jgi:transcriptional regulator with XRE-family HTH domain
MSLNINKQDIHIGHSIRDMRKKVRWSMKILANHLNISVQQLHKYETAYNKISASLLYKIARVFEVPIERFFRNIENDEITVDASKFNILLIEDNLNDEIAIRDAINSFPNETNLYSIHEPSKALDYFRSVHSNNHLKPDIILLELNLQKSSGLDLLKNIKRDKNLNLTPVVLLADRNNADEITSSYNLHAGGFIVKSCSIQELKDQVHNILFYWTKLVTLPRQ